VRGVCPSYVNGDKRFFCIRPLIEGDAVAGERAYVQFNGFGNIFFASASVFP